MAAPPERVVEDLVLITRESLSSISSLIFPHSRQPESPPPPKKIKESTTMTMVVERWRAEQVEQVSAVHRIGGFPWRLRLSRCDEGTRCDLSVICDKSAEAELWQCSASPSAAYFVAGQFTGGKAKKEVRFSSWGGAERAIDRDEFPVGMRIDMELLNVVGECPRLRPTLDLRKAYDGILEIGAEKEKVPVHKQDLASQSSFFNRLFYGDFKNRKQEEFAIEDVEYEEFFNILKIIYGQESAPLTENNVPRLLTLAGRFDLKLVEDRVVSYLLSSSSSFPIHRSLVIAQNRALAFLKAKLISRCSEEDLAELTEPGVWERLTSETTRALLKRRCEIDREK